MNTLLGAARAVPCPSCGQRIQWLRTLHTRILAGGLMFRIGVAALLAIGLATVAWPESTLPHSLVALVGAALAVAGVLVTYTPASQPLVELASDDA
jgi:hypothetical protein